jgi:hypothetical protein
VQTFRAISWLIVKWTLVVVAALVGIAAVVAGGLYGFHWYTHERHAAKVQFIVEYDQKKCADPFPLHIIVGNLSGRTINKVSFWVEARKPGYPDNRERRARIGNMIQRHSIASGKCYRDSLGAIYRVVGFDGNGVQCILYHRSEQGAVVEREHSESWANFLEDLQGEVECPGGT